MRYRAYILIAYYACLSLLGHAGLHSLFSGHTHSHAQTMTADDSRIVSCYHAPGDESHCDHRHHCDSHDDSSSSSHEPASPTTPDQHEEEDCQICHHFGQDAVRLNLVLLTTSEVCLPQSAVKAAEIYACYLAASFSPRGPPAELLA